MQSTKKMIKKTVKPDIGFKFSFNGALLGSVSSFRNDHNGLPVQQWTELELWSTSTNKLVCISIGKSTIEGRTDRVSACVADNITEASEMFCTGDLSKQLFEEVGVLSI